MLQKSLHTSELQISSDMRKMGTFAIFSYAFLAQLMVQMTTSSLIDLQVPIEFQKHLLHPLENLIPFRGFDWPLLRAFSSLPLTQPVYLGLTASASLLKVIDAVYLCTAAWLQVPILSASPKPPGLQVM